MEVQLENMFDTPLVIYHAYEDSPFTAVAQMESGEAISFKTGIGYTLMAKERVEQYFDSVDNVNKVRVGGVLDYFQVDGPYYRFQPKNRQDECEVIVEDETFEISLSGTGLIPAKVGCADMDDKFKVWSAETHYKSRVVRPF